MTKNQAKGYLFEVLIAKLLKTSGYEWQTLESADNVQGRGAKHEIDAIGLSSYLLPFVNNIRLLAEAKYRGKNIGLAVVRNMVGILKDVNESYNPRGNVRIADKLLGKRNTNSAVIFSNQDFARNAIDYAYAHNIFLISYKGSPVMQDIIDKFESVCTFLDFEKVGNSRIKLKTTFALILENHTHINELPLLELSNDNGLDQALQSLTATLNKTSSTLGFIGGSYPVHIMSRKGNVVEGLKAEAREKGGIIPVGYTFTEVNRNLEFRFSLKNKEFSFTLPRYLFPEAAIKQRNLVKEKESYLKNVLIPIVGRGEPLTVVPLVFDRNRIV